MGSYMTLKCPFCLKHGLQELSRFELLEGIALIIIKFYCPDCGLHPELILKIDCWVDEFNNVVMGHSL